MLEMKYNPLEHHIFAIDADTWKEGGPLYYFRPAGYLGYKYICHVDHKQMLAALDTLATEKLQAKMLLDPILSGVIAEVLSTRVKKGTADANQDS